MLKKKNLEGCYLGRDRKSEMEGAELRTMKVTPGSLLSSASLGRIRLTALSRWDLRNRV